MADNATPLASLLERAEDYSKTSIELFKLNAIDKSADVLSSLVSKLAIFTSVALSLLIINVGLALWIGKVLGDNFFGFFIVGGFYAVLSLLLYVFKEQWIKNPLSEFIIKEMLKKKKNQVDAF